MSQHPFAPGDFAEELFVTDTRVLEVLRTTASTVTVRTTRRSGNVRNEHVDGNPIPVSYDAAVPDPDGDVRTLRVRKDGTLRTMRGGRPLRPATLVDGVPVNRTDYRV